MKYRYFSLLDGTNLTNEDKAADPQYYGYTRHGGTWVIMEYNEANGTYKFYLGKELTNYDSAWTDRASLTYKRAGEFKKL